MFGWFKTNNQLKNEIKLKDQEIKLKNEEIKVLS
jgi:hypothetical protein